ncbi:extracellular solute-binding protein [Photobacterium profundum]|uniref:extracellular solute-binding protein n=1 Tax=Photobacterium profundum TaxID=74109 RepID=UPI003D118675
MSFKKAVLGTALTVLATTSFSTLAYDVSTMSWDEIEVQAKKEGSITFAVWYLQPQWRSFIKNFEQETGIKVRVPEGTSDGNRNKLMAESRRDKGSIDVMAIGASDMTIINNGTTLLPLEKLPEYSKLTTRSEGVESNGYAVTFWGNQTGLAYDPTRIDESKLPQTFEQMETFIKNNPMAFGVNDPNGGGAGQRFIESALRHVSGESSMGEKVDRNIVKSWSKTWDWFQNNKEDMLITASNADSLTRINDGEISIAPAWEDHLSGLQNQGAITDRIKFYIPEFGMSGGGNFVGAPSNGQNKAASLVFINWLTSAKTQAAMNKAFGIAPQHPDSDASHAMISAEMRQNSTESFNAKYAAELKKQFTRNVLMQ